MVIVVGFLSDAVNTSFQKAVYETMIHREKEGIVRSDMINLLLQAQKGTIFKLIIGLAYKKIFY